VGGNVNNTMIDKMLSLVAPHPCSGCGKVGSLLCDDCKSDIISHPFIGCIVCDGPSYNGVCRKHHLPYKKAWVVGERRDTLQRLISSFKFQNAKEGAAVLATLLDERLPHLPENTVVVPIPTIAPHVRQRGYDHTRLIAKQFAKRRHLDWEPLIQRKDKSIQKNAGRLLRKRQATKAFYIKGAVDPRTHYLVVDDVITTGATLEYASQLLKDAGATSIWVGAIARQPLD